MLIIGVIHIIPLKGLLGKERLNYLYGIEIHDKSLEILMQHRAAMLGIFGLLFIFSAFNRKYQKLGIICAYLSVLSFLILTFLSPVNPEVFRVVIVDTVVLVMTIFATVLYFISTKEESL